MGNCSSCFHLFKNDSSSGSGSTVISFEVEEVNAYLEAFNGRKFIGKGAFGSVYHGIIRGRRESNINGKQVAVKVFRSKEERVRIHWQAEKEYLPKLLHQNIIEMIGYCETPARLYLVYPFMHNGTLLSKLAGLDWSRTLKIVKGIANAVRMLHAQKPPLVHRDLKLNNVLLDKDFTPKLADFGMVAMEGGHSQSSSGNRADDIYNLGVMIPRKRNLHWQE